VSIQLATKIPPIGTRCLCNDVLTKVHSLSPDEPRWPGNGQRPPGRTSLWLDIRGFRQYIRGGCRCRRHWKHCSQYLHQVALDHVASVFMAQGDYDTAKTVASEMMLLDPTGPAVRRPPNVLDSWRLVLTFSPGIFPLGQDCPHPVPADALGLFHISACRRQCRPNCSCQRSSDQGTVAPHSHERQG